MRKTQATLTDQTAVEVGRSVQRLPFGTSSTYSVILYPLKIDSCVTSSTRPTETEVLAVVGNQSLATI